MLTGYVISLAPTVTLWDAGEFITAAKVLGVPHQPGTPLFVMMGHVWADLVAVGQYAWRLNLMSASFSAAGAGCLFLVIERLLAGEQRLIRLGGAAAAALLSAFTFTGWQNSNETEVYAVATFSIAAMCWLVVRWRDLRDERSARAPHLLLLIIYLAALSIGNHLLALLAGPAVSLFIFYTLRTSPSLDRTERNREVAEWIALTALWGLLIAVGLGSSALIIAGGILLLGAVVACFITGSRAFPVLAIAIAAIGISTYAFLYIRSTLQPVLDESNPETWHNLVAMIRRDQFGQRGLFDNPMFFPGKDNPGRNIVLIGEQLINYFVYCGWQWARSLPAAAMYLVSLVYAALGFLGFDHARRRDAGITYLLVGLWLVTGLGLVAYMNFKAGFSIFWNVYPSMSQHEVRERDYFFVVSFQVWGLFAGLGLVDLLGRAAAARWALAAAAFGGGALLPFALNFQAASRRGPDAYVARDFAYNLLESVEPYGVLFGFGDNDTFPVWYLQEVEGIRQDVTLVNLSLANLDWYDQQLASRPLRRFDPRTAPAAYRSLAPPEPPPARQLPISADQIAGFQAGRLDQDVTLRAGSFSLRLASGTFLRVADQVILFTIAGALPNRPVTFGQMSGRGAWLGLDSQLVYQGLVYKVVPRADTVTRWVRGIQGTKVDTARTRLLVDSVFQFGNLFSADTLDLEPAADLVARSFSIPFLELGTAALGVGDSTRAREYLSRAYHLNPQARGRFFGP
ncbi:MAG TPA: DUF2723 domain-containing protein [Gemmatimonadales bacterium]|nr:DUF2723 domain-containing protein [Gemmatimonadales bacterium]